MADAYLILALVYNGGRRDADPLTPFQNDTPGLATVFWAMMTEHSRGLTSDDEETLEDCLTHVEADLTAKGSVAPHPPPCVGPFAELSAVADRLQLKANDAKIIKALCNNGGCVKLANLAIECCWVVDPKAPSASTFSSAWGSAQARLNKKLKPHGWRISRHDNHAVAKHVPSRKTSARK